MTLRWRVLEALHQHPDWTGKQIADALQCTKAYVSQIRKSEGLYRKLTGPPKGITRLERIQTKVSPWTRDEQGNLTRQIEGMAA